MFCVGTELNPGELWVTGSFAATFTEILFHELAEREVALRHYVHYLKEMGEQRLLVELLK